MSANPPSIVVVEDEDDIQELLRFNLEREGFLVTTVDNGSRAIEIISSKKPDLILLDIMLPGLSGLDICKRLKASPELQAIPIVMLTARGEEADIVVGLELGADDYITKPFGLRELIARIRACLRKVTQSGPNTTGKQLQIDGLFIDAARHLASLDGEELVLTATEFSILHYLAKNRGFVFTRKQVIVAVHGENYPVTGRSIDVQITSLRKKLGRYGDSIETVRGVGYRFKAA